MPELTHYELFGYASAAMLLAITVIEIVLERIGREVETTFSPRPSCLARDVPAEPSAREESCA